LTGRIVDVQRASRHDGPGIRTTVFFKGCPLHCAWCHNPESISFAEQEMFYPEQCIGCGHCKEGCLAGARVVCGRDIGEDELLEIILADKPFYQSGGGVTFSGGEPLAQREFLRRIIGRCRENSIHTAVETCMAIYDAGIFAALDLIMADLKLWDEDQHHRYCGGSAVQIRENFRNAAMLGTPIVARTPIIPGVNDQPQELDAIATFLAPLVNVIRWELLPYHPLGQEKARALGAEQQSFPLADTETMAGLKARYNLDTIRQQKNTAIGKGEAL
jgi:glycyl-radical enzyme activating protein